MWLWTKKDLSSQLSSFVVVACIIYCILPVALKFVFSFLIIEKKKKITNILLKLLLIDILNLY